MINFALKKKYKCQNPVNENLKKNFIDSCDDVQLKPHTAMCLPAAGFFSLDQTEDIRSCREDDPSKTAPDCPGRPPPAALRSRPPESERRPRRALVTGRKLQTLRLHASHSPFGFRLLLFSTRRAAFSCVYITALKQERNFRKADFLIGAV